MESKMPTESENPYGLHRRYKIRKADGSKCDPNAIYFVLRLDSEGDDFGHISACRAAARAYADFVLSGEEETGHLTEIGEDLNRLLNSLDPNY